MNNLPLIVSGVGRCGSSMLMQMLVAGGMDPGSAKGPSFEDGRPTMLPDNPEWLKELHGNSVVKILAPGHYTPPLWFRCNVIWLSRNKKEQAKSMVKFAKAVGRDVSRAAAEKAIRQLTGEGFDAIKRNAKKILMLKYELVLSDPRIWANAIADTFNTSLDIDAMVSAVVDRDPRCLGGLLEYQLQQRYAK